MPRQRWALDVEDWPTADQLAWHRAFVRGRLFEPRGLASHWAEPTRTRVSQSYGQWLHFLMRHGRLDPDVPPCARATEDRTCAYFDELSRRIAPISAASALRDLGEALRVMDPNGSRVHVQELARYAQRTARPSRDERHKLVGPSEFYFAGLARMQRFEPMASSDRQAALGFGDGLMMSIEVCKSVRRKNLVATDVGTNLVMEADGRFGVRYGRIDVKTKKADIEAPLAASLTPFLDAWLSRIRIYLLAGGHSRRMWLNGDGTDMTPHTLYARFCRATEEELDVRINPHFVRNIVATGVTVSVPGLVEITQHLLDHTGDRMRRESYDLAAKLAASVRYIELLEQRRREALDKLDEEDP